MKSLVKYIDEKLVINKNYADAYNYYPNDKDELMAAIREHYDKDIYDLNDIDVSKITDFSFIFDDDNNTDHKDFNISKWDVSRGENFKQMFKDCTKFNCDLSKWNISKNAKVHEMFYNCGINRKNKPKRVK